MKAIEIKNFTKIYHQEAAISDVNLSVEVGEIFGFIGPNGAGKSTTIRGLLDFIKLNQGSATIFGKDTVKDAKEIRQFTSYVSSDVRFYPQMTTSDILNYVVAFHGLKNIEEETARLLELFQIDQKKKSEALSLGNKKKIALAAALLPNPKLLILDEPTNGLDPLMQHRLFEELERRNREGMTIFLSSHDLNGIQAHAQRAAFIRQGKIVTIQEISREKSLGKVVTIRGNAFQTPLFTEKFFTLLSQSREEQKYLYGGDTKELLTLLKRDEIIDFTITTPDLEDQFMALYEGEDQDGSK